VQKPETQQTPEQKTKEAGTKTEEIGYRKVKNETDTATLSSLGGELGVFCPAKGQGKSRKGKMTDLAE
jgi:hypothetical protein